ncbi:MAG: class I SAM-dependent methyltransferase [Angustibacter sp.]
MATSGTPADDAPPAARNARLFDALADSYDAVGVDFFGPIADGLLELLAPRRGERFVDLGCGKGALLLPAAQAVGGHGRAVGVDVSEGMLSAARAAADEREVAVELVVGDAQAPALPAQTFDVVGSSLVLFFLADPPAALAAWRELLVPGGRLGVSTFGAQDDVWRAVDDVFTPYLPQHVLDARTSGGRGPFASDEGMERLLADAGLTDVRTVSRPLRVRFRDADHWAAFSMSTGQRAMWAAVPEADRDDVRQEAVRRLAAGTTPDGGIELTQDVRYTLGRG